MARHIWGDETGRIYRAVVTVTYETGKVTPFAYGPYSSQGAAKRQATREAAYFERWGNTVSVTSQIESAFVFWEPFSG
jgi:hypothetical protein